MAQGKTTVRNSKDMWGEHTHRERSGKLPSGADYSVVKTNHNGTKHGETKSTAKKGSREVTKMSSVGVRKQSVKSYRRTIGDVTSNRLTFGTNNKERQARTADKYTRSPGKHKTTADKMIRTVGDTKTTSPRKTNRDWKGSMVEHNMKMSLKSPKKVK